MPTTTKLILSRFIRAYSVVFFMLVVLTEQMVGQTHPTLVFDEIFDGFSEPIAITNAGDGSDRIFVVERAGRIKIIENGAVLPNAFLDISTDVNTSFEMGLLGLTFHPEYPDSGYFYVHYNTAPSATQISRFEVSSGNPNLANAGSEESIFTISQPADNHNGGTIKFGADGYLYIALGDGGSTPEASQEPMNLLGKMLRLDIDNGLPYTIPGSNPFTANAAVADEIWAFGLRNPFRWSFDRLTNDLWISDVGQDDREEVNFASSTSLGGENYGWKCYEGNISYQLGGCLAMNQYDFPVFDYQHDGGPNSICGGYVYRGKNLCLYGVYIAADTRRHVAITIVDDGMNGWSGQLQTTNVPADIAGFGEDESGELYCVSLNGEVYKVNGTTNELGNAGLPSDTYTAGSFLSSSGTVLNGANVIFQSGESIELLPLFEVQMGGILTGEIGCGN